MRGLVYAITLCALPALADPIAGLNDPAFRAPFERALQGDDPTALTELHAAAEAGNTAALLALPSATDWLRHTLSFTERKALARVNGVAVEEAVSAIDPVAALWAMGDSGPDPDLLLDRAFGLYAAGESEKASMLFMTWLNQTGGYRALPPGFFDQPVPRWAIAILLRQRLEDPSFGTPAEADALLVERLMANDPAAYLALAGFAGMHRDDGPPVDTARLAAIFKAAGVPQEVAAQRMAQAVPVLKANGLHDVPLDPVTAVAAVRFFSSESEFLPLIAVCQAACPATSKACITAFVAGFGHPYWRGGWWGQPFVSLIPTEDFFATPRGRKVLLNNVLRAYTENPAASPGLAAARQIDACFADAVLSGFPDAIGITTLAASFPCR